MGQLIGERFTRKQLIMNTTIKSLMVLAAATVLVAGCEDELPLVNTEESRPVLGFETAQTGDIDMYGKTDGTVSFMIHKSGDGACSVNVTGMTQEQLNEYEPFYTPLTSDCYTVEVEDASLAADEMSSEVKVSFSEDNISRMMDLAASSGGRQLALALRIESEDADVDADRGVVYWTVTLTGDRPVIRFAGESEASLSFYEGKDVSTSFSVAKIGNAESCSVRVVPVSQEELSSYNSEYVALPSECYSYSGELNFLSDEFSRTLDVSFSAENLDMVYDLMTENEGRQIVLALALESEDAEIDADKDAAYRTVSVIKIPFTLESISGIDNAMNGLAGIDALDKGDLLNLPSLVFSVADAYDGTFSLTVKYRPDLAQRYNETNQTSYQILPEGVVGFDEETIEVGAGQGSVEVPLKLIGEIPDITAGYLFPVEISSEVPVDMESIGNVGIQENVYYVVLASEVKLTADNLYSPCTAPSHLGGAGGGVAALVNNINGDDFWSSDWTAPYQSKDWHHFIQVRFPQPLTEGIRVQYWNRPYDNPMPTVVEVWVTDKETVEERDSRDGWVMLGSYNSNDGSLSLSADLPWSFPSYIFSEIPELSGKKITYMRFCIVETRDSGGQGSKEVGYGASSASLSELKVWGN